MIPLLNSHFFIEQVKHRLDYDDLIHHFIQKTLLFEWSTSFPNADDPKTEEYQYKNFTHDERQHITSRNTYNLSCYFYDLTQNSKGGAVCVESSSTNNLCILIESTIFSNCRVESETNIWGAAVLAQYANTILHAVCGYSCYSTYHDAFCNIQSADNGINSAIDCSISNCQSETEFTMFHDKGSINITRVNLSDNKSPLDSALFCYSTKSFTEESKTGIAVCYCSFSQNNASQYICIHLQSSSFDHVITRTNIIKNKQDEKAEGLIQIS